MSTNENSREKPQRLAPIVEVSRAGEKIVGWVDRRTGKRVNEDGSEISAPKSAKRSTFSDESDK